jgi:DNA-binding response OmpR family regulator
MILVDLGLADSQGLDTLRELRGYKVPKVILTARFDLSSAVTNLGAIDYIVKTTPLPEIYERIMFNIAKVKGSRKLLSPSAFEQLKTCVAGSRQWMAEPVRELTLA